MKDKVPDNSSESFENKGVSQDQSTFVQVGSVTQGSNGVNNFFLGKSDTGSERLKSTRSDVEQILIREVKTEIQSRLNQNLHGLGRIPLIQVEQPEKVSRIWDSERKIEENLREILPSNTQILDIFDRSDIDGKFLILGKPGAGKTTTLLDLANALIERTESRADYPIPVLLNLSSNFVSDELKWDFKLKGIEEWLISEVKSKYGLRHDYAKSFVENRKLLPMFDGLDELSPSHQVFCLNSINQWLRSETRPLYLIVCCRSEEYQNLVMASKSKLYLNTSIHLQAITEEQLFHYLSETNYEDLGNFIQSNVELLDLVKTPFWLRILMLIYSSCGQEKWQMIAANSQDTKILLDNYVRIMLGQRQTVNVSPKALTPTFRVSCYWLTHIAWQMAQKSQTEFLIEDIQPECLHHKHRTAYRIITGLIVGLPVGMMIGSFFGITFSSFLGLSWGVTFQLTVGLFFCLIIGYIFGSGNIRLIDNIQWSWDKAGSGFKRGMLLGGIIGLCGWTFLMIIKWLANLFGFMQSNAELAIDKLFYGVKYGLIYGIVVGVICFIAGIFSELNTGDKSSLRCGLVGAPILGVIIGIIYGFFNGLLSGFVIGCVSGVAYAIRGGIRGGLVFGRAIEPQFIPNNGIWRSARSAITIAFIGLVIGGISGYLIGACFFNQSTSTLIGLASALLFALTGGLLNGGDACIRHLVLRLFLYYYKYAPCNYNRFLDYSTDKFILQRVGGRYRFIDKILQDYFSSNYVILQDYFSFNYISSRFFDRNI